MKILLNHLRSFALLATASLFYMASSQAVHAQSAIEVAIVNGETIYLDEVMQMAEQLPEQYRRQPLETYFDQLVQDIVATKLAAKAAAASGLQDNDVLQDAIRLATERILAEAYMADEVRKVVTEEEIQNAYDRFVANADSREEISARHILLDTKEEAVDIITKLEAGADSAALAKEFSTGPSGPNGGDLGYFGRGQMVPDFEVAAFGLEIGTFSAQPVQTQFGWHVIKLDDKRIVPPTPLAEMRQQIATALSQQALARVMEELRSDAVVETRDFEAIRADAQASQQ